MKFTEYPQYEHTFIVHHITGFGDQGGAPMQELEVVFTTNDNDEATRKGEELFPLDPVNPGWTWDRYTVNVNTCTAKGKELLDNFQKEMDGLAAYAEAHPEKFTKIRMPYNEYLYMEYNPLLDGPKNKTLMNKNAGQVFHTDKDQYAIMRYSEQQSKWVKEGKLLVRLYKDHLCQDPVIDDKGQPVKVLKRRTTLTPIGYVD